MLTAIRQALAARNHHRCDHAAGVCSHADDWPEYRGDLPFADEWDVDDREETPWI